MNRKLTLALVIMAATVVVAPVLAMQDEDKPSKIGIRLAVVSPLDSNLRNLKSIWMGPAFDYHLKMDKENRPASYVSLAIIRSGNQNSFQKGSITPLTYTMIKRRRINENQLRYLGFGGGICSVSIRDVRRVGINTVFIDGSTYLPELHGVYGREFNAYFAEVQLNYMPKWKGDNWTFISLNVGTRFGI